MLPMVVIHSSGQLEHFLGPLAIYRVNICSIQLLVVPSIQAKKTCQEPARWAAQIRWISNAQLDEFFYQVREKDKSVDLAFRTQRAEAEFFFC